jgi:predicted amino acid dehydrogenase
MTQLNEGTSASPGSRVAWLCHAIDARHLTAIHPSLHGLTDEALESYFESISSSATASVLSSVHIRSLNGATTELHSIMLPVTSQWMKHRIGTRRRRECQALVQTGIDLARQMECNVVALGQYTSIVTHNGRSLESHGMGVTTGNSYAAALTIQAIDRALLDRSLQAESQTLAIVGAAGNIGRAFAETLACRFGRTILLGSGKLDSEQRLREIAAELSQVEVTNNITAIEQADVVLVATNSVTTPLNASHFKANAIVCDVSVPANLHPQTAACRPDLEIMSGGIVRLPFAEELNIPGFPLPTGYTFGCMAEGILLSFESTHDRTFTGLLTTGNVSRIEQLAIRHGMELAEPSICSLSSLAKESAIHANV